MTKAQVVYVDCSPLMRSLLDEIGPPAGMKVFDGDPSPDELADLVADAAVVLNGHTDAFHDGEISGLVARA